MKTLLVYVFVISSLTSFSQTNRPKSDSHLIEDYAFDARRIAKPPVFPFGIDSLQHFYFTHFAGFDSVLTKAIANGDTSKYLRVYFSFVIDKEGAPIQPHFIKVSATQFARSDGSRTLKYFDEDKSYLDESIKKMIFKMNFWKAGWANIRNSNSMTTVDARVEDYIQFWVGLNPPQN